MGEPPHRVAQALRALLCLVLLVAPASPIAMHSVTSEAETHHIHVVDAAQHRSARARCRTRRPEWRIVRALARAIVSLRPLRVFSDPPLPPLRV